MLGKILIRLAGHTDLNPHKIDKLIVIKGLPYEWVFKKVEQGDQLLPPWEPDVEANIPVSIRHLSDPISYCKWFPDVRHYDQTYKGFWDTRQALGLKLDMDYGPALEKWAQIHDFIEGTIPRTEKMPQPVMVAPDQKSPFAPVLARKNPRSNGLEFISAQIPVVDLSLYQTVSQPLQPVTMTTVSSPEPQVKIETKTASQFQCQDCNFQTDKKQALRMHSMKKHPQKEKVTA